MLRRCPARFFAFSRWPLFLIQFWKEMQRKRMKCIADFTTISEGNDEAAHPHSLVEQGIISLPSERLVGLYRRKPSFRSLLRPRSYPKALPAHSRYAPRPHSLSIHCHLCRLLFHQAHLCKVRSAHFRITVHKSRTYRPMQTGACSRSVAVLPRRQHRMRICTALS